MWSLNEKTRPRHILVLKNSIRTEYFFLKKIAIAIFKNKIETDI